MKCSPVAWATFPNTSRNRFLPNRIGVVAAERRTTRRVFFLLLSNNGPWRVMDGTSRCYPAPPLKARATSSPTLPQYWRCALRNTPKLHEWELAGLTGNVSIDGSRREWIKAAFWRSALSRVMLSPTTTGADNTHIIARFCSPDISECLL